MAAYTTVDNPELYFQTVLWTGNDTTATAITGVGFQPDMTWIKERSQVRSHVLFDVVRGATVQLNPNDSASDATVAESLQSFDADGFTVGDATSVNESGETYVGWNWKESATAGFDIVSFTGNETARTIAHSLSAVPKMIIAKDRDANDNWNIYNATIGNDSHLHLNVGNAASGTSTYWQDTTPTSSVFYIGDGGEVNKSGNNFIAYCFADVQGYSKFGSYTGNQDNDGPFIYTGFRPALLICKQTTSVKNWFIKDNKRLASFNPANGHLYPNQTHAGEDYADFDFLSNGIKIRHNGTDVNESGETYVYAAFAEAPFVNSNGVPCNAR